MGSIVFYGGSSGSSSGGITGCIPRVQVADIQNPTELASYDFKNCAMVLAWQDMSPNYSLATLAYYDENSTPDGISGFVVAHNSGGNVISLAGVFSYSGSEFINVGTIGTFTASTTATVPKPSAATHAAQNSQITDLENKAQYLFFKDDPGLVEGSGYFFDSLTDQTGIDDTASTGESYDADNDLYTNAGAGEADTWTLSLDTNHPHDLQNNTHRNVISAANISTSGSRVRVTFEASTGGTLVVDHAAIVERSGSTAAGTTTPTELLFSAASGFTCTAGNTITSDWVDFDLDETKDYLVILDYDSDGASYGRKVTSGTVYYKSGASYDTADGSGFSSDPYTYVVNKIEVNSGYSDMVLVTEDFTASAEPTYARPSVFVTPINTITINTDLKAYASRDGGTTWNQATLALIGTYGTVKHYAADVTLTSTGTTLKLKAETANTKRVQVTALGLSWR